jgi:hypothetical protein
MCLCPSAIDMEAELTDLCESTSSVIEEPFRIEPSLPFFSRPAKSQDAKISLSSTSTGTNLLSAEEVSLAGELLQVAGDNRGSCFVFRVSCVPAFCEATRKQQGTRLLRRGGARGTTPEQQEKSKSH